MKLLAAMIAIAMSLGVTSAVEDLQHLTDSRQVPTMAIAGTQQLQAPDVDTPTGCVTVHVEWQTYHDWYRGELISPVETSREYTGGLQPDQLRASIVGTFLNYQIAPTDQVNSWLMNLQSIPIAPDATSVTACRG